MGGLSKQRGLDFKSDNLGLGKCKRIKNKARWLTKVVDNKF